MATSVTSSASPAQAGWQALQVQMAKRNADQAEQRASALRAQATEAQRNADRAQESARQLSVNAEQAETTASRARQGVSMLEPSDNLRLTRLSDATSQAIDAQPQQLNQPTPQPVVNTQGQVTGTTVNTSA